MTPMRPMWRAGRIAMRPYVTVAAGFVPFYPASNGALYP